MKTLLHTVIRLVGVLAIGAASSGLATLLNPHDDDGLGTGLTFFLLVVAAVGGWALADGAVLGWLGLVPWLVATAASPFLLGWTALDGVDPFALALVGVPALGGAVLGAAVREAAAWSGRRAGASPQAPIAPPHA